MQMKKHVLTLLMSTFVLSLTAQKVQWTSSTESKKWVQEKAPEFRNSVNESSAKITIFPNDTLQQMNGFGGCFNELGWDALQAVSEQKRNTILNDLFSKEGANFTFCRMPLGSNDYSFNYYSYNDVPEDFEMKNFSIDRDRYILIPYIKAAMKVNPKLKIWASPWCPPIWMKVNNHYAMGASSPVKNMDKGMVIENNATAFRMENRYLQAYALYFSRFVQEYKKQGINLSYVMVQNEPIYQPHWQSCTWRPDDLAFFIGKFLGPQFQKDSLATQIWLGTVNSGDPNFTRTILNNKDAAKYIKGIGMQWDAKQAIPVIHKEYPNYPLMQTESECGNGEGTWKFAEYTWSLINRYISNGAGQYMYWNMVLDKSGISTWGWKQNMMIAIDTKTAEVRYTPEYYLMKHLSHFVLPGAKRLNTSGGKEHLAFINPDGTKVVILVNTESADKKVNLVVAEKSVELTVKSNSFNTLTWR
jgi:O-Glycosyl hydrolase